MLEGGRIGNEYVVSVWKDEKFWKCLVGIVAQQCKWMLFRVATGPGRPPRSHFPEVGAWSWTVPWTRSDFFSDTHDTNLSVTGAEAYLVQQSFRAGSSQSGKKKKP